MLDRNMMQLNLLQDGLSCAAATLFAIEAGDLFRALPADPNDHVQPVSYTHLTLPTTCSV